MAAVTAAVTADKFRWKRHKKELPADPEKSSGSFFTSLFFPGNTGWIKFLPAQMFLPEIVPEADRLSTPPYGRQVLQWNGHE